MGRPGNDTTSYLLIRQNSSTIDSLCQIIIAECLSTRHKSCSACSRLAGVALTIVPLQGCNWSHLGMEFVMLKNAIGHT